MIDIAEILGSNADDTFFGVPKASPDALDGVDIAILGIPCATPYASTGTYAAAAPKALRKAIAPYAHDPVHMDFDLAGPVLGDGSLKFADCGDLVWSKTDHGANRKSITETTKNILDAGAIPIALGGDDSIPIPFYEAFSDRGPFTILQIDAHIDWRDSVDGEPLGLSSNMRRASEMAHIENIIQVGARNIGSARPSDYEDAVKWGVEFVMAREFMETGINPVIDKIPENANLLINFDVDGLDPSVMPAVIGPAPGGLSYWQVVNLIQAAMNKASLAAFSIVEFYPERDTDGVAALTAARIVSNVLGNLARR